jgi:hypothetical protein
MDERSLELLDVLARALMVGAVVVLVLSVVGAIAIGSSESSIPGFDELQRENRGVVAVATVGAGIAGAGVMAGLGAILRLMIAERRERQ